MKQLLLILILSIFTTALSFSQETKLKTVKFKNSKELFEKYSVLKSDKEIKHGAYVAYFKSSDFNYSYPDNPDYLVRLIGNYLNGKKDGEWIEYIRPLEIKSKGFYQNGKKAGIWETVKEDGQITITERYDFDTNKKLNPHFKPHITYPSKAAKAGIEGVVLIEYYTNKDCSVKDLKIIKSLSLECDQEVMNMVRKIEQLSIKYGMNCEEKIHKEVIPFRIL